MYRIIGDEITVTCNMVFANVKTSISVGSADAAETAFAISNALKMFNRDVLFPLVVKSIGTNNDRGYFIRDGEMYFRTSGRCFEHVPDDMTDVEVRRYATGFAEKILINNNVVSGILLKLLRRRFILAYYHLTAVKHSNDASLEIRRKQFAGDRLFWIYADDVQEIFTLCKCEKFNKYITAS